MKKRLLFGILLYAFMCIGEVYAQTDFNVSEITVINTGDGKLLFRTLKDEKPLQGEHRLIDGYKSEYITAQFKDGMYDGSYQYFRHNKLVEKGTYKGGVRHGDFVEYISGGETVKSEKSFNEGKLNGLLKTYYANGKPESEIGYKNGKEHGVERRYDYNTGKLTVECNFIDGKPDGRQIRHISSNVGDYVQISNFKNGVQTGDYSETWKDGKIRTEGKYSEGKKDGKWVENRKDGKPLNEINYKNGERNGESKLFFTDGTVEKIDIYVNGEKEGICKEFYYESGKIKTEYTFANGQKNGKYKLFYDDGTLREEGRCDNGQEIYRKEYYRGGQLKQVSERGSRGWEVIERYDSQGKQL